MNTYNGLQEKINRARDLNFGDIINNALELFKKVWLKGFVVILLIAVVNFALNFVFGLLGLAPDISSFFGGFNMNAFFDVYTRSALYSLPQSICSSTITILLLAAFYMMCKDAASGKNNRDDYFYFFKKEYLTKALILGVIYAFIASVTMAMLFVPYIYAFVPLSYFAIVFAANPNLREMEIVKLSFALGNKKWLITFGCTLLCVIMGMLGVLGCGIGLLFTLSIAYLPAFLIYKDVIGFEERDEIDFIGKSDNDNVIF